MRARWLHAAGHADEAVIARFRARRTYIGQLELLAAVAAYTTFADELRGRDVIHWIDNTGALAALIKGYAREVDSARIVHAFHALGMGLRVRVWLEYVASKANIADFPSRGVFDMLSGLQSEARPLVMPALSGWEDEAAVWAQLGEGAQGAGRRRRPAPDGVAGPVRPRRRRH